jgi:hypothetical protein
MVPATALMLLHGSRAGPLCRAGSTRWSWLLARGTQSSYFSLGQVVGSAVQPEPARERSSCFSQPVAQKVY